LDQLSPGLVVASLDEALNWRLLVDACQLRDLLTDNCLQVLAQLDDLSDLLLMLLVVLLVLLVLSNVVLLKLLLLLWSELLVELRELAQFALQISQLAEHFS